MTQSLSSLPSLFLGRIEVEQRPLNPPVFSPAADTRFFLFFCRKVTTSSNRFLALYRQNSPSSARPSDVRDGSKFSTSPTRLFLSAWNIFFHGEGGASRRSPPSRRYAAWVSLRAKCGSSFLTNRTFFFNLPFSFAPHPPTSVRLVSLLSRG